ncbi:MAG: PBP1A family penicillin-binding protein [Deltaproteobacteria bacterium]|nr:PBP1A family penicillin-binding protein [Deltaproteobacteria bacterium]
MKKRSLLKKALFAALYLALGLVAVCVFTVSGVYMYFARGLPQIETLKDYRPKIISTVYALNGEVIGEFFEERRIVVPIDEIPQFLIDAFVAAEDSRFFEHKGLDYQAIVRALLKNIEAGEIVQGGSTITQQVARSLLLSNERSWSRKIREAILAARIERYLSKREILHLYLNQIYLGHGAYGVEAAAENYFGKKVTDLNLAEAAVLAGLPRAPSKNSPYDYPENARKRQIYVLQRMEEDGYITHDAAEEALATKLEIKARRSRFLEVAPYFTEYVRQILEKKYGRRTLYTEGLKIYTSLNVDMQKAADRAVSEGLRALDKRQGYRGPERHLSKDEIPEFLDRIERGLGGSSPAEAKEYLGVVTGLAPESVEVMVGHYQGRLALQDMLWARKPDPKVAYNTVRVKKPGDVLKKGDVIRVRVKGVDDKGMLSFALEQIPKVQGALISMEIKTGYVVALVGGRDFRESQFNRAIQARRQPGSAFKPIVYAAAIDHGYTPATIIVDSPIIYDATQDYDAWKPKNYEERFYGPTTLRNALAKSRNVITVKIAQDLGVDYLIDYAKRLNLQGPFNRDLSMALGSSGVSLIDLTKTYAVFANQGREVRPIFIRKVVDRDGKILEQNLPPITAGEEDNPEREGSPSAKKAAESGRSRPGTAAALDEDFTGDDRSRKSRQLISPETAYIMTNLLEGVVQNGTGWRVKALKRPCAGKTGTTDSLYDAWFIGYTPTLIAGVWVGFDEEASMGKYETGSRAASPIWLAYMREVLKDRPIKDFTVPQGIVFKRIDPKTGLLALSNEDGAIFECFKEGTAPTAYAKKPTAGQSTDFFKFDLDSSAQQ